MLAAPPHSYDGGQSEGSAALLGLGCGGALLLTIVIALLVYAISGGQCTMIVFP
jgi:hypothetical protein